MKKTVLRKYASLIANVGARVKKGQEVIVYAELDQPEFVKMLVEECYKSGAKRVDVEWSYQPLAKTHVRYRSVKTLSEMLNWEVEKLKRRVEVLPVMIYLLSEDPDGLNGMNQQKYSKGTQARYKIIKPFRDEMENKYQWCIAAVPGVEWAKKVFPECRKNEAVEKLWEAILMTSRCDDDPVEAWNKHNKNLKSKCDYLNSLNIESLHYTSKNGTDLTVGLIDGSEFAGGGEYTLSGNYFNPNIPSEEVFISPERGKAEGIVYSVMPLSYRGELIENFSIKFENGKATDVHAEKNEDLLKELINMDEGAAYLGECALVPFDSPIRNSGILFYNTLFDENAACHLALGEGFSHCIKGSENMTLEECREKGINKSMIHEDFMIGAEDMNITAKTRDGKEIPVFRNGNWAF